MSMATSSAHHRVETDALIIAVGCWRKRQRMRQPKDWIWAKGQIEHKGLCTGGTSSWSLARHFPTMCSEAMARMVDYIEECPLSISGCDNSYKDPQHIILSQI